MSDDAPRVFTGRLELIAASASGFGAWQVVEVARQRALGSVELTAPDGGGAVECRLQLDGKYASEAVGGLIDWAFSQPDVRRIVADADRDGAAAIRVLVDNGLTHVGDGVAPNTLRFELARR